MSIAGKTTWTPEYNENRNRRRRRNKKTLIDRKGGKCCICGYNSCDRAMDFHHLGEKNFAIAQSGQIMGSGAGALEKLKKEVDLCILVCKNCHQEIHSGMHEKYNKHLPSDTPQPETKHEN